MSFWLSPMGVRGHAVGRTYVNLTRSQRTEGDRRSCIVVELQCRRIEECLDLTFVALASELRREPDL